MECKAASIWRRHGYRNCPAGKDRVQKETERLLLARYAPACVLNEENLNVLYFHRPGETGRYSNTGRSREPQPSEARPARISGSAQ